MSRGIDLAKQPYHSPPRIRIRDQDVDDVGHPCPLAP